MINQETYRRDRESWRQRWYNKGYFGLETVSQVLDAAVRERPNTDFFYYRTAPQGGVATSVHTTAREMWTRAAAWPAPCTPTACAPVVFAVQLPTWYETTLLYLAALRLGATVLQSSAYLRPARGGIHPAPVGCAHAAGDPPALAQYRFRRALPAHTGTA